MSEKEHLKKIIRTTVRYEQNIQTIGTISGQ